MSQQTVGLKASTRRLCRTCGICVFTFFMLMNRFSTLHAENATNNLFFGHLLCYRSTLAGLRRCLEGNPGTSWLFFLIDPCEFDMCLINWRIFSSANCFNVQM